MDNPLVSICIPTFNGEKFIAEAMESAISQTYPNIEIVVSDDASKDNTLVIIEQFREKTIIPINIYHHQPNGIGANWNNCIKYAKGVYIKFLFQDDILLHTCIEEMLSVIKKNKKIGLVACKREFIVDESINNVETKKWIENYGDLQHNLKHSNNNNLIIIDAKIFKSDDFFKMPVNKIGEPTTFIFRKELINKVGYFREDLNQILDYEFCCRVLKKHKIAIINNKLIRFRLHINQATLVNKQISGGEESMLKRIIYVDYFWYLNIKSKIEFLKTIDNLDKKFFRYILNFINRKRKL